MFDCENQYGEIAPQQEKALEALGFELPEPEKPVGRKNNRKMTFDSACRVLLFDVAKKHGLQLEEEPEYGGRAYLEKQDYILFKQKEQLAAQEQKLEELTMKIEDVEALVDEVADIAYDKAVEVVADKMCIRDRCGIYGAAVFYLIQNRQSCKIHLRLPLRDFRPR